MEISVFSDNVKAPFIHAGPQMEAEKKPQI